MPNTLRCKFKEEKKGKKHAQRHSYTRPDRSIQISKSTRSHVTGGQFRNLSLKPDILRTLLIPILHALNPTINNNSSHLLATSPQINESDWPTDVYPPKHRPVLLPKSVHFTFPSPRVSFILSVVFCPFISPAVFRSPFISVAGLRFKS